MEDWVFKSDFTKELLTNHFKVNSLKGFGIDKLEEGIIASGTALHYLSETQHKQLNHITNINRIEEEYYVWMDRFTIRNLELYQANTVDAVTLLDVIDQTISPMGGRLLKRWLALPLKDVTRIKKRPDIVKYLIENEVIFDKITSQIKQISDLERLISKVATARISPRELVLLKTSLDAIIPIKEVALQSDNTAFKSLGEQLQRCESLRNRITEVLFEEAPVNILKGNAIKEGFSQELDELRGLANSGKTYLNAMLKRESEHTQIPSLKIASNNVYGYYIEVRNTHKNKVPEAWTRKQTLVNAERYITPELKEYEAKILGAEEKIAQLEQQLFSNLVSFTVDYIQPVQPTHK